MHNPSNRRVVTSANSHAGRGAWVSANAAVNVTAAVAGVDPSRRRNRSSSRSGVVIEAYIDIDVRSLSGAVPADAASSPNVRMGTEAASEA